jgi:arylsulfatase A-like enzyme
MLTMRRSTILAPALFLALAISTLGAESPNILLILVDDMGYGDSRIYNPRSQVPMPNLESLAERGMVFTDAHSAAGTCAPSRYSMLTGNYPWRGRKPGGTWRYNEPCQILDHQETLGTLLKKAGYQTAIFGKLHQGGHFASRAEPNAFVHDKVDNDHETIDFAERFRRVLWNTGSTIRASFQQGFKANPTPPLKTTGSPEIPRN